MWPCTCRMATKRLNASFIARPHICSLAPTSTAGHATLWGFWFFFHFVAQQFQMMAPVITRVITAAVFCAWHFTHNHSTNSHLSGAIEAAAFLPVSRPVHPLSCFFFSVLTSSEDLAAPDAPRRSGKIT